jgi:hypothetical protein
VSRDNLNLAAPQRITIRELASYDMVTPVVSLCLDPPRNKLDAMNSSLACIMRFPHLVRMPFLVEKCGSLLLAYRAAMLVG